MVLIDRMSTPSQHLQSMDMLSAAQERMNRLQDQVSSGKAISRASDDPSATQSAMKLRAEHTRLTQVKLNVDNGLLRLNATMDQVDSINNQLLRVQDLLVQGQQPSATANVRSALAAEVNVLKGNASLCHQLRLCGPPIVLRVKRCGDRLRQRRQLSRRHHGGLHACRPRFHRPHRRQWA